MAVLPTPGSPMRTGLFLVRAAEDLDDAADLLVAADDRVELAGAGLGGQVAAVLLERLVGALGVLATSRAGRRGRSGAPARMASRPAPCRSSRRWRLAADLGDAEQQVLGRDVLVAEAPRLVLGPLDDAPGARVEATASRPAMRARRARTAAELAAERRAGRRRAGGASRRGCRRRARRSAARRCSASRIGAVEPLGGAPGRRGWPPGPSG